MIIIQTNPKLAHKNNKILKIKDENRKSKKSRKIC